jgi:tRNA G18 (ribose-2'-O)-methylase SpoU
VVPIVIENPADERLAGYQCLTDAELRRRYEADRGVFVAEGVTVIRQVLTSGRPLRSVLVTPAKLASLALDLETVDAPVYVAAQVVMNTVAGFNIHRGALALVTRPALPPVEEVLSGATRVAVLERINDQENVGSLFRNAAAFGLGGLLLCPECCDPLYRRCVRVSMGHVLSVPWTRMSSLASGLALLRAAGFSIVALTPERTATPLDAIDPSDPSLARVALLLGAEGPGLSGAALAGADQRWRIPTTAGVDSINVATAAAVAFHHLAEIS